MDILYVPIISFLAAFIVGYILGAIGIEIKLPDWGAAKGNNDNWADKYLTSDKPIGPPKTDFNEMCGSCFSSMISKMPLRTICDLQEVERQRMLGCSHKAKPYKSVDNSDLNELLADKCHIQPSEPWPRS